jgi:ribosomal protein L16/L10AE
MDIIDNLRAATENDVNEALEKAATKLPIESVVDLLEAYNRILDQRLGLPEE